MNSEEKIAFKSPLQHWTDQGTLFALFFVLISIFMLLGTKHPSIVLLLVILGYAIFYGFRYLFSSATTIEIKENTLSIEQYNRILNKSYIVSIPIDCIRGYEITQVTRGNNALFIYDQSYNYYKYSIIKTKDRLAIDNHLIKHLKKLNQSSNPLFPSFFSALLFAFKQSLLFITLSFSIVAILYFLNQKNHFWISDMPFIILSILTGFLFWWFIIRRQAKRKYFRFGAYYWIISSFFYASPLLILPLLSKINQFREEPVHVKHSFELMKYKYANFFMIDEVSFDPKNILLYSYSIGSSGRKHKKFSVDHHFATLLGGGGQIKLNRLNNSWLAKTYQQSINKSYDPITKQRLISSFRSYSKDKFISSFSKKPIFYTVIEYDDQVKNLIQTSDSTNLNIIIEPHWESISVYKQDIKNQILAYIGLILGLNLIGCIVIAVNR